MKTVTLKIFLFYFPLLISLAAYTQNNTIDSLQKVLQTQKKDTNKVNTLNELSSLMIKFNVTPALQKAKEALSLAEKMSFKKGICVAYNNIGEAYYNQNNYPEALAAFRLSLKYSKEINNKRGIAKAYEWMGRTIPEENKAEKLQVLLNSLRMYKEIGYKEGECEVLQILGANSAFDGMYGEALIYLKEALKIVEEIGNKAATGQTLNSIGLILAEQGKYAEAIKDFEKSVKLFEEMGDDAPFWGLPWSQMCMSSIYIKEGEKYLSEGEKIKAKMKFNEAVKIGLDVLKIYERTGVKNAILDTKIAIAYGYVKLGDFDTAKRYYFDALKIAQETNNKFNLKILYNHISNLDSIIGDYKNAFLNYKKHILYRDSLSNDEDIKKVEHIKMQYEFDKKQDSIKVLQDKKDLISAAEIKDQKLIRNFSFAGIFAVLSLGGYGFYRYKKKKQLQHQQALMNERLRISRELHDEVGATLSGIAMYSHLTKEQIKTSQIAEVEKSLSIMQQSSGEMVNKLNDIVWLINPEQDSLQKLIQRLEEYATDMATIKNMKVKINVPEHLHEHALPMESRRNIYLFCKEAINNAVKYSNGTLLELNIKESNNILEFSVSDNGKGFDAVMVRRGNGLENMQKRANEIGGKLIIQSKQNEGVFVSMQIKIT